MTKGLAEKIPAIGSTDGKNDADIVVHAKLFSPYTGWRWYVVEMNPDTGLCFGFVEGYEKEFGYFDLTELAKTMFSGTVPALERDLYWESTSLAEITGGRE